MSGLLRSSPGQGRFSLRQFELTSELPKLLLTPVTIPHANQITMTVTMLKGVHIVETTALIDSGSTFEMISPELAKKLGLKPQKLEKSMDLICVDGSQQTASISTHVDVDLVLDGHTKT